MSTYVQRPHLSEELNDKIDKSHPTRLGHAVAVVGPDGAGKTQLVLRYIEDHGNEYDAVVWIDASTENTIWSSYAQFCHDLGLPVEIPHMPGPLEDVPPVQAGLAWLQSRADDSRWLVVLDNVGPFSTDLSGIAPKGSAGTVIVTGQDARASEPLGESIPMVEVGAMEPDEALDLLRRRLGVSSLFEDSSPELAQELTSCLERSAFAIDLAAARIAVDMDKSEDISSALRRYLADYQAVRDKQSDDVEELFVAASTFETAMSMALEVTMSSLKNLCQ